MDNIAKLVAAGAVAGFLGFGGVSLASAQEDPTTTTPTTRPATADDGTSSDTAAVGDENCPHDGEADGSPATGDATTR